MKKILMLAAMLLVSATASATDFGLVSNRNFAGTDRTGFGLTLGQKFGIVGVEAGYEKQNLGVDQTRWSLLGSYDVVSFEKRATLAVKGGAAYLDNQSGKDGYAWLVGTGLTVPLTSKLSATLDYRYQWGQDRVKSFDGATIGAGLKYSF